MAFGPDSNNPREQRAFAHAVYTLANESPSLESRRAALEQSIALVQGPRKSRRMVLGLGSYMISFVSGAYSEPGNQLSPPLSRDGGDRSPNRQETLVGFVQSPRRSWREYRVGMSVRHEDRIADPRLVVGGEIPLTEALDSKVLSDVGWTMFEAPYKISTRMMTIEQVAVAILHAEIDQLPFDANLVGR